MIKSVYSFDTSGEAIVEKIINDTNIIINHVVVKAKDGIQEHASNANTYFVILKGIMCIRLDPQEEKDYSAGNIINIPSGITMKIDNRADDTLEFFIIKAPVP